MKFIILIFLTTIFTNCNNPSSDEENVFSSDQKSVSALSEMSLKNQFLLKKIYGVTKHTFSWQNKERRYFVHLPPENKMNKPLPILFVLHPWLISPLIMIKTFTRFRFNKIADDEGFIVVYPAAVGLIWNTYNKNSIDDEGFIVSIINRLKENYSIDENKIFSAGFSNGGFMTSLLLCHKADTFRGGAVVSGSIQPSYIEGCNPQNPVALMVFHGTKDHTVPFNGKKEKNLSFNDYIKLWQGKNGCATEMTPIAYLNNKKYDGTQVEVSIANNCLTGGSIKTYKIIGGGHNWPGGGDLQRLAPIILGLVSQEINACDEIWDYFKSLD